MDRAGQAVVRAFSQAACAFHIIIHPSLALLIFLAFVHGSSAGIVELTKIRVIEPQGIVLDSRRGPTYWA
ncbi:MAG: hypothetical protein IH939_07180 [Acidobacteria bacterium]|nr:hypothetical protein [Acidobacteriota bacterium]